jgi:hypothetical protein
MIQERQILCKRGEIHYLLRTRYLVTVSQFVLTSIDSCRDDFNLEPTKPCVITAFTSENHGNGHKSKKCLESLLTANTIAPARFVDLA